MDLPKFEGRRPVGTRLKLNGLSGDATRPMRIGERVFVLLEAEIIGVDHDKDGKTDGIIRVHTGAMERALELVDEQATYARKLLDADSARRAEAEAAGNGQEPIPGTEADELPPPPEVDEDALERLAAARRDAEAAVGVAP